MSDTSIVLQSVYIMRDNITDDFATTKKIWILIHKSRLHGIRSILEISDLEEEKMRQIVCSNHNSLYWIHPHKDCAKWCDVSDERYKYYLLECKISDTIVNRFTEKLPIGRIANIRVIFDTAFFEVGRGSWAHTKSITAGIEPIIVGLKTHDTTIQISDELTEKYYTSYSYGTYDYHNDHFDFDALRGIGFSCAANTMPSMKAYWELMSTGFAQGQRSQYPRHRQEIFGAIFLNAPLFWDAIQAKVKTITDTCTSLLSQSYIAGFIAVYVLGEHIDEHDVLDFFDDLLHKRSGKADFLFSLREHLSREEKRYGIFPSKDTQLKISDAWMRYFVYFK